jgi:hypothetical protein
MGVGWTNPDFLKFYLKSSTGSSGNLAPMSAVINFNAGQQQNGSSFKGSELIDSIENLVNKVNPFEYLAANLYQAHLDKQLIDSYQELNQISWQTWNMIFNNPIRFSDTAIVNTITNIANSELALVNMGVPMAQHILGVVGAIQTIVPGGSGIASEVESDMGKGIAVSAGALQQFVDTARSTQNPQP